MTSRTSFLDRSRRIFAAAVALSLLPITACTGGGATPGATAAPESSSPAASPAQTATPTPTASYKPADATGRAQNVPVPVLPEAAKAETKEGLEAFARYWFQLLSYGYETGDLSRLVNLTSSACRACDRAKTVMTGWNEAGRWLVGGKTETPSVSTKFVVAPDGNYQVAVQVSQGSISYYNADGTLHQADPKPDDTGNLMLAVFRNGAWYVNNIQPIVG